VWSLPVHGDSRLLTFKDSELTAMSLFADGDFFILTGNKSGEISKWDRLTGSREASVETGGEFVAAICAACILAISWQRKTWRQWARWSATRSYYAPRFRRAIEAALVRSRRDDRTAGEATI
jgi:hypothetical protein